MPFRRPESVGLGGVLGIHVSSTDGSLVTDLALTSLTNATGVTHSNLDDTILVTVYGLGLYKIDVLNPSAPLTIGHVTTRDVPRHMDSDLNGRTWVAESGAGLVAVQF